MGLLRQFAGSEAKAGRLRDRILQARGRRREERGAARRSATLNDGGGQASAAAGDMPAFVDVAQLRGIEGMTPELYAAIAPFLTVYSGDGRINPRAAPDEVLDVHARADAERHREAAGVGERAEGERRGAAGYRAARRLPTSPMTPGPAYLVTVEVLRAGRQARRQRRLRRGAGLDARRALPADREEARRTRCGLSGAS